MMLCFHDIRWNSWRWRPILEKWGHLRVFINPAILKTATFLSVNAKPISTVFFIRWPLEVGLVAYYAVTTRHSLNRKGVYIEFNKKGGGRDSQGFSFDDWIPHPSTDVAVLPLLSWLPLDDYDIEYIDVKKFARNKDNLYTVSYPDGFEYGEGGLLTSTTLKQKWAESSLLYGVGDEVFTVGLFEGHKGQNLAQPVARFGHIALNPGAGEKIFAEVEPGTKLEPIDALLVEMATWAGQSGSPVFLRVPGNIEPSRYSDLGRFSDEDNYLIGMIQGFYPGEQEVKIDGKLAKWSPLPMGIGIVIPARDIWETLMQDELKKQRDELKKHNEQNPTIRPSAASIKDEAAFTKESFENALKRVSRKISSPPDEEKTET